MSSQSEVEAELAALKAKSSGGAIGTGSTENPKAIDATAEPVAEPVQERTNEAST